MNLPTAICLSLWLTTSPASADGAERPTQLSQAFLEHVQALGPEYAAAARQVRQRWPADHGQTAQQLIPEALAVLYPGWEAALTAFDEQRYAEARARFAQLRTHPDPYVAANARYFHARCLVACGLLEETEQELENLAADTPELARFSPFVPHLWFLRASCQAANLRPEAATQTLRALLARFPAAPEPVRIGARQLLLEIERRESGTLAEVADVMAYSADRLAAGDTGERVRRCQAEAVRLLDMLIAEQRRREEQRGGRGQRRTAQPGPPRAGARDSTLPEAGPGRIGDLHGIPSAQPGETWGQLPPAERERILQSLRERFPSRYRQLVEQYYRSLAEEK